MLAAVRSPLFRPKCTDEERKSRIKVYVYDSAGHSISLHVLTDCIEQYAIYTLIR